MQICMQILIKMREEIFVTYFLIWCPSDFNYAIGVKDKKEKILFEFVNFILNDKQNSHTIFHYIF